MLPRNLALRALRASTTITTTRTLRTFTLARQPLPILATSNRLASHVPHQSLRFLSSKSPADDVIEEITELYATAQDEFEIAMEETENNTVYAEEDRKAAREELGKVQEAYRRVIEGGDRELAEEVRRRVGQRVRELEAGVDRLEAMAIEHD